MSNRRAESTPELPPGYPADLEHDLTLSDGRVVHVRPVVPSDRDELRQAIGAADPETIHARFLGAAPPMTDASLRHLVEVDYMHRLAVAAFAPDGHGVGIARYEGSKGSDNAEIAVVVDREWRHNGIATDLVRTLGTAALAHGIRTFDVMTFVSNGDVQEIVIEAGLPYTRRRIGDIVEEVIQIGSERRS